MSFGIAGPSARAATRRVGLRALLLASALGVSVVSVAAPVQAEGSSFSSGGGDSRSAGTADSASEVEQIVVTANRRNQNIQDVPYAISAVTGADLTRDGITDINGLSHEVPGVVYLDKGPFGGIANNSLIIHGLNVEAAGQLGANITQAPVATYVDDAPVFVNLHLTDIDQVEVLRGPQGTLYGSGSLGGTVRFLQRNPDPTEYQVIVTSGVGDTYNSRTANGMGDIIVNLPITSTLALRFEAGDDYQAGFINQPNLYALDSNGVPVLANPGQEITSPPVYDPGKDTNDYTYHTYRAALLWQPTDKLRFRFNYNHQESDANGSPTISPGVYGYTLNSAAYIRQTITDKIDLYSGDVSYDLGFATLTGSVSEYLHRAVSQTDGTLGYESFPFYTAYYGSDPRPLIDNHNDLIESGATEEIRLASAPSNHIEYVVGLYYSNQHSSPDQYAFYPGYYDYSQACQPVYGIGSTQCGFGELYGIDATENNVAVQKDLAYLQQIEERFEDRAIYGELTWHITPKLQVTGGVRVFSQLLRSTEGSGLLFVGPSDVAFASSTSVYTSAIGKADISYKFNPDMTGYINWSQGFRRGELNALPVYVPYNNYTTDPQAFKATPDTVDNYETGLKGTFHNIRYDLSAYDIQWHNIQATIAVTPLVLPSVINVGEGYSRGIDLAVSGYLTDHIFGQVNYSLNESKLTSASQVAIDSATSLFVVGGRFPGVPENMVNWRFEYQQRFGADWRVSYGVDGNYRTETASTISANSSRAPGFQMWDLYVSATHKDFTVRLYVDNVNNTLGISAVDNSNDSSLAAAGAYISTPRTVGLSLTYNFSAPR